MMLDLYLNVTLASVTKALEPLMSSVTKRVIKELEKRGVSANYLSSLYGSLDGGTSKIEYKPKVDVEPDIKPDFGGNSWDSKEVREALKDTYGDDIADTLYEFGENGVELAEKYGNGLGGGLGGLNFNDGRKALELINKYGDEALELLESGKNVDEVAEMLGGMLKSYEEFSKAASDIGIRSDLTDAQKVTELQKLFEKSNYKTDINVPSDIQYVKGFDSKGNVIYDWPSKLGFDESTIKSISRDDGLPDTWDRYGYMGGSNFADVPPTGKYTYSERAIPYVENEAAYHTGTFNNLTYFDKIDAIKNGDIDAFNELLQNEGISKWDLDDFEELCDSYDSFISKANKELGDSVDATYGIKGIAEEWGDMSGGAGQIVTPFGGDVLEKIGILKEN